MALTTDATPRLHLSPQEVLQDKQRMKRLKAAFCDGIFRYADESTACRIIEDSAKICGASSATLSEVVQTKFFAEHTPFYWVIISRHSQPGTPPLLTKLFGACTLPLTKKAQEDVLVAFYTRYDSNLYLNIKDKLSDVPSHVPHKSSHFRGEGDWPVVTAVLEGSKKSLVELNIPRFFDRLVVDEEIILEFLAIGAHWRLEVRPTSHNHNQVPCWQLKLVPVSRKTSGSPYFARFTFIGGTGQRCSSNNMLLDSTIIKISDPSFDFSLSRYNDNLFTANQKGELSCVIEINYYT